ATAITIDVTTEEVNLTGLLDGNGAIGGTNNTLADTLDVTGSVTATTLVQGEHIVSTDDADINNNLTVGDVIIDEAIGTLNFSGGTSATISTSTTDVELTLDVDGSGGTAFVEIIDDNNAGFLALGRTSATAGSRLSITDGGGDNKAGELILYEDDGNGSYLWYNTASVLRTANTAPTDDDADGYAIIDASDGTIGATGQQGTFDDVTLADDLLLATGAVVGITGEEIITFTAGAPGTVNFSGCTVDIDGAATATSFTSDATITATTFFIHSVTATITATNPGVQGDSPLTTEINEISVVGADNDAVTLPSAVTGYEVFIINNGANTLEIFPASNDNLGAGVDAATTLIAGANITFVAFNNTDWETK
ncbi:hypothetical protein LCGC14_1751560, partial [marine sediment metagenome]